MLQWSPASYLLIFVVAIFEIINGNYLHNKQQSNTHIETMKSKLNECVCGYATSVEVYFLQSYNQ